MAKKKKINTKKILRLTHSDVIMEGDPKLRDVSEIVAFPLNRDNETIIKQMIDYVRSSQDETQAKERNLKPAVGISAVQIGHLKKMMYVNVVDEFGNSQEEFALINPKVISTSKEKCYLDGGEGCLSVQEGKYQGISLRSFSIKLEAIDYFTERIVEIDAKGYTSIVLQHELDHLNGILYFDRINKLDPHFIPKNAIKI